MKPKTTKLEKMMDKLGVDHLQCGKFVMFREDDVNEPGDIEEIMEEVARGETHPRDAAHLVRPWLFRDYDRNDGECEQKLHEGRRAAAKADEEAAHVRAHNILAVAWNLDRSQKTDPEEAAVAWREAAGEALKVLAKTPGVVAARERAEPFKNLQKKLYDGTLLNLVERVGAQEINPDDALREMMRDCPYDVDAFLARTKAEAKAEAKAEPELVGASA